MANQFDVNSEPTLADICDVIFPIPSLGDCSNSTLSLVPLVVLESRVGETIPQ